LTAHINSGTHKWSSITDKPSTLKDYGIGDAYTKAEADSYREEAKTQIGAEQSELGVEIKGRTLVNLLGKDGNFEAITPWLGYHSTLVLDQTNIKYGSNRIKVTIDTGWTTGYVHKAVTVFAGKYYLILADVINGTSDNGVFVAPNTFGNGNLTKSTTQYITSYRKFTPAADITTAMQIAVSGKEGQYAYVDGFRMYEITQAEYNAIDSMTEVQVAATYPYVDSAQFKKDVLITQIGKNLFDSANVSQGYYLNTANAIAVDALYWYSPAYIPVKPSTQYTESPTYSVRFYDNNYTFLSAIQNVSVFTTPTNCAYVRVTGLITSLATYQLELGSTATTFEPQVKSYAHTPMQIAQDESVWLTPNTSVYKEVWKKNVVMEGSLTYGFSLDFTGFKAVRLPTFSGTLNTGDFNFYIVKSDGSILRNINTDSSSGFTSADQAFQYSADAGFRFTILDTDSGWTDAMTPTNSEIQAYFYGWKMCASDGSTYVSGTKYWKKITDGTGITSTLPTASYAGYTPYVLHYKLVTPVYHINYYNNDPTKPIMNAGSVVNISQGITQIEQKSGVVWPEKTDIVNKYSNTIPLLAIDNPATTRQRNFLVDFNEQKIAYFKINNSDLAGTAGIKNPSTLADLGILDAYTKGAIDTAVNAKLNLINGLAGSTRHYRDIASFYNTNVVTGIIKILLPVSWMDSMINIELRGFNYTSSSSNWSANLSGYNYGVGSQWIYPAAVLSPNCPFNSVRFGYDSATGKCCILLGTTTTSWAYPAIKASAIVSYNNQANYGTSWLMSLITNENGITGIVTPAVKTLATLENPMFSGSVTVTNTSAGNIRSGYFNNNDYAAGNRNYIQVRQQVASNSSYSAMLGVDKDTGNVWLSNDAITVQHLAITPSGKVGIGPFAKQASRQLEVTTAHTTNVDDDIRFGSYANSTTGFYGLGLNYRISSTGNPSAHIINYRGDTKYTNITLSGDNVGIGTTNPTSLLTAYYSGTLDAATKRYFDFVGDFTGTNAATQSNAGAITALRIGHTNAGKHVMLGAISEDTLGWSRMTGMGLFTCALDSTPVERMRIKYNGNVGIGITDPKTTLHSTGSIIVGIDRSNLNYTNIGNSQMQMSLSESDNVLWLDAKRSDGTIKQIGLPLGSSTIITGTNLWVSSEYQPVVNTVTSVAHGLTLDPVRCRCDVLLKCVVAQGNYSVGDFAMGVIVNVGGSAEFVLSPALDSANIRVNSGSGGPYAMNKTTGAYFQVTPANWRYVFRIWY
jgi:hypothetical protein